MSAGRRLAQAWNTWASWLWKPEAPHALAALRISFGLALVINVVQQVTLGDVLEMYAEVGQGGIFGFRYNNSPYTLFRLLPPTAPVVYALVCTQLAAAVMLTVGLYTRAAAVVCWLIQATLFDRMVMFRYDGDNVYRVICMLMTLAPVGAAWSADAAWRHRGLRTVPRLFRRMFILQLAIIYTRTGLVKMGSTWSIQEGWSALYLALNLPAISRYPGDWAAQPLLYFLTQVGTFVSSWWEVLFWILPLSMYLRRTGASRRRVSRFAGWRPLRRLLVRWDLRPMFLGIGVLMHGGILLATDVGLFSVVMVSLYPAYLQPHEVRAWVARLRAPWRARAAQDA